MMSSNNIIVFPSRTKEESAEQLADSIMEEVISSLAKAGYYDSVNHKEADVHFIFESIRSYLLRSRKIGHPIQEICDKISRK